MGFVSLKKWKKIKLKNKNKFINKETFLPYYKTL